MSYLYFIGIDISKDSFHVAQHNSLKIQEFPNNNKGFQKFIASLKKPLSNYFITLEATGGYEMNLLLHLCSKNLAVHRLQTLKSAYYLRSLRVFGKNDILDSQALARFGAERHENLPVFVPPTKDMLELQRLTMRRDDLITMRVTEKQRSKHSNYDEFEEDIKEVCHFLTEKIAVIEEKIAKLIDKNQEMRAKKEVLCSFKGVGVQTSHVLLTACPELGTLTRRQIASLAGVAPHPRESGMYQGYRSTKGGRGHVKKALFMAVLSAKSYNPVLKAFYDGLIARGKKKMVALTATMRKMIVILNAKIRDIFYKKPLEEGIMGV